MSAFLLFSQGRRNQVKDDNPGVKNTEISRLLGEIWRSSTDEEKKPFVDEEKALREKYKIDLAAWKEGEKERKEDEEKRRLQQLEWQKQQQQQLQPPPPMTHQHAPQQYAQQLQQYQQQPYSYMHHPPHPQGYAAPYQQGYYGKSFVSVFTINGDIICKIFYFLFFPNSITIVFLFFSRKRVILLQQRLVGLRQELLINNIQPLENNNSQKFLVLVACRIISSINILNQFRHLLQHRRRRIIHLSHRYHRSPTFPGLKILV
jgi:hypothetical protein